MLDNRGNTLIMALIGTVITAMLAIQISQMFNTSFKSSRVLSSTNDWEQLARNLVIAFETESNCTNAFSTGGAFSTYNTTVAAGAVASSPDKLSIKGGKMVAVGDSIGMYHVTSITITSLAAPTPYTYNSVARYQIPVSLNITATKDATGPKMGRDTLTKNYLLNLVTEKLPATTANIVTCSSSNSGPSMQQICNAIVGGIYVSASQTCRIGVETRTSDPASPANGQMWLRTDL